jgi:hypothetical protein
MTPEPRNASHWSFQAPKCAQTNDPMGQESIGLNKISPNQYQSLANSLSKPQEAKNKHIMATRTKVKMGWERPSSPIEEEIIEEPKKSTEARKQGASDEEVQGKESIKKTVVSGERDEAADQKLRTGPVAKTAPRFSEDKAVRSQLPAHPTPPQPSFPRFQNKSHVEKKELVDEILEMMLGSRIEELTFEHLLAASGEVRARLMNLLRPHRIEVMQLAEASGDSIVVSHQVVPLREVRVLVNGRHAIDAVLDSGSSIITVREDLWREMGELPINPKDSIQMQTADANRSLTMGSLRNLKMQIGEIVFYVQAQVVSSSPCKILLGEPFLALMRTKTETYPDGFTAITLTDPNDPSRIETVATKARGSQEAPSRETLIREVEADRKDSDDEDEYADTEDYELIIPSFVYEIQNQETEQPF